MVEVAFEEMKIGTELVGARAEIPKGSVVNLQLSPKNSPLFKRERTPAELVRPVPVRSVNDSEFRLKAPPLMVRPFDEERPAEETPERVLVAVFVWLMMPPEMVRPLEEARPAVSSPPLKEEVALALKALKEEARVTPETDSAWLGVVVPMPTLPVESMMKAVEVAAPVEVLTAIMGREERVGVEVGEMEKTAKGEEEPRPNFPAELVRVEVARPVPR